MICSHEQRQSYKQDFNKEYNEYRDLHARIDSVTQQFMDLDTQLKQLHHESHKYKVDVQKVFIFLFFFFFKMEEVCINILSSFFAVCS